MKQKLKKSLSLLLAVVMLLGLIPGAAFAEEVVDKSTTCSLTLTAGVGMAGENLEQTVEKGQPITPVVLTAEEGYTFPEDYAVSTLEAVGLTVLREGENKVIISGDLTATLTLALPAGLAVVVEEEPEKEPSDEDNLNSLALADPAAPVEKIYYANESVASLAGFDKVTIEAGVTVTLTGTTTLTKDLTITGEGTLKRGTGCTGNMFTVGKGKTLTLDGDLTLDGANIVANGSAVYVDFGDASTNGGIFAMGGGAIQNFRSSKDPGGAAVYIAGNNFSDTAKNGTFTMTDGTIKDNRFENKTIGVGGGAIAVLGNFTMTGGLISNNYSATNGGAIGLLANNRGGGYAKIEIGGNAQIVGNTARRWGGAMEAMANRDCGITPAATLKIYGNAIITGNLSGYQNDRLNDGFGGGLDTSDWGGSSSFTVDGTVQITGNNHWTTGGYTQDNLYCSPSKTGGWPVLGGDFSGSIGVTPSGGQSVGDIFGDRNDKTVSAGSFFHDGKALVNDATALKWVKGEAAKTITKVTVDAGYAATVAPTGAAVTYQWYVSDTSDVSGGLPIPEEANLALSSDAQKANRGRYVYVIADGRDGYTGRATSAPMEVAPEVTPIRGDFTLYYSTADGLLHKGGLTGAALTPKEKYGYSAKDSNKTLVLSGIDFITSKGGIEMPYNTSIELADGTVNYIESTSRTGDDWQDCGIHVGMRSGGGNNTLTIKGSGSLTVKGACAAIMVHYSSLVINGSAVVVAEGNGYPGSAKRDSAGIYAMDGITVQDKANVTALGGPCAQNSYGAGSNKGGVTVKNTAVLTVAGGQTRDKSGTYRSMGISTADKFNILDDASVIARGDTVAADIWYTSDQGKNKLTDDQIKAMFAGTTIEASTSANGSGATTTTDYVAFAKKLDWKDSAIQVYKWMRTYRTDSAASGTLVNPTFLNASGDYSGKVTVDIASADAEIFYTINGTEPSKANGAKYTKAFNITRVGLTTVKAIAYKGEAASPVTTVTYNVLAAPKLTGLSVTGYPLSPAFTADNYGPYVVVAPGTVTKVDVIPTASASIVVKKDGVAVSKSGSAYPINLTAGQTASVTIEVGGNAYILDIRSAVDTGITKDVYEPLTISSGFNKDVVVEKPGTPSSSAVAFDGLNSAAQWAFFTKGYRTGNSYFCLPDTNIEGNRVLENFNIPNSPVFHLGEYDKANSVQLSWDNSSAKIEFSDIGAYDRLSILGASGNADGRFRATIHYTDGSTSSATFTAPNWAYFDGQDVARKQMAKLSRVKLISGSGTNAGTIETDIGGGINGFALFYFEIPVTAGKLVSYLEVARTDTSTGDAASRTNIMAVSGVVAKGTPAAPETEPPDISTGGVLTAKWGSNPDAIGYYIDIAGDVNFLDMLPGYDNKKLEPGQYTVSPDGTVSYVTDVTSGPVYYRVRAIGADGKPGQSSDTVDVPAFGDKPAIDSGNLKLYGAVQGDNQTYTFPNAIVGTEAKTIIVGFADTVNSGDWIELPNISGFSVSTGSNDYSKRIAVGAGKKAADIQDYLRQIVFHLGKDSYTNTGKQVQVTLDSKQVENDTFYFEGTRHYYQYVPFSGRQDWMQCYETAKSMTYAGRKGYLATVTSREEDMFIKSLSGQIGWLGGTRMVAAGDAKDTNAQYFDQTMLGKIVHTASAHSSNPWIWACGPEIGKTFLKVQGADANDPNYTNWNSGEPNGESGSGDSHECALTTLFKGAGGYSWNDRSPYAGPGVGTGGYQPYGYFVEFGDQGAPTWGDSGTDSAANTSVTDTGSITKATSTTDDGGTDSLDMTQMPEFDPANPDWKPIPGTTPAEYRYEGVEPANNGTWEWVYTMDNKGTPSQDDYYSLVLKGVNITTTSRPAISLPDLPRGSLQPVHIKVQDGTENFITNLEDTDLTTNVTIINSKRDLVIEPLGNKADGTLKLIGSNLPNSKEGVFGIVSYGKVTVSSLEMTIELTDNRDTAKGGIPDSTPTTGVKSEAGDIVLDNPKLDIIIHDNRPFTPDSGVTPPVTSATPPARGLEPGYPSNNVVVEGGEVDIKFDGEPNAPKGDSTYPTYRPVYTDEYPRPTGYIPADHPDKPLFPIQPAKPVAKAEGNNIIIYAKGSALLVVEGTDTAKTTIYHDVNRNGELDSGEVAVALESGGNTTDIVNAAQTITLYAGANDADAAGWPLMTIAGGKVNTIYAGGYATSKNIKLTGAPVINITGGTVEQIYDGGNNTLSKKSAITTGVVTVNISGGVVTRLDSRADAATRSESVYVNMFGAPGGEIVTLTPNAKNPINLSIEGSAKVGSLLDFNSLAGKHINVTGPLTSGTEITFEETLTAFAPGTLLAQAENPDYVKQGSFYLMDSLTRKTAKGVQVITEGAAVKIASGGPTKLDNLDLGNLDIPTDSSHDGWTGPKEDGTFDYNVPAGEGWELKYDPKDDGRYYLTINGLNIDTSTSPALQLPNGKPTTIIVKGDNKLTVRGDETGAMAGIDAPMGVDFEGMDKTKDILTILVNNSGTGAVTGVRSDKDITITDVTVKVLLPASGAPAIGMKADDDNTGDGDVVIKDADVVIDIPTAAPAAGVTTPGNIEIIDTKPGDGKRPTVEIDIEGKDDKKSVGLEAGAPAPNPAGKGDIIIGGGEIHIDISTGKPAIGIKADDDVIIDKGDPTDPGKPENDDGVKPGIEINIGDIKANPKKTGHPAIGIQGNDNDKTGEPIKPGGIIIGGGAELDIDIPNAPGNYQPEEPVNPGDPAKDIEPNKGLDSRGDVVIGENSDITIGVTGPGTGIKTEPTSPSKGDVIIKDSDLDITVKPDPKSDPATEPNPTPAGPAIGVDAKGDIEIIDTKPNDEKKPDVNIFIGDLDHPDAKGAPIIGLNTDPTPADTDDGKKDGGDVIIGGVDLTINIPNSKGTPNIGINSDKEVIIAPDPAKPIPGPNDPASKPGDKDRPNIDIIVGDLDTKYDPANGGPGTGIKGKEDIVIGGADLDINIPNIGPGSTYPNPAKYDPNKGIEGDENITIGDASDLVLDITGPGAGIKGKEDVVIESSDVDVVIKKDPDAPTQKDDSATPEDDREPTTGVEAGGKIEIKDTTPAHRRPGVSVDLEGDGPTKGLETEPGTGNDIIVGPGSNLDIEISKGAPAIGVDSGDDVIIGTDPTDPAPAPGGPKPARPDINIQIGDKFDPNSGGQPGKGIVADKDITIGDTDVIVDVNTKPAPTVPVDPSNPGGAQKPDPTKPATGLEAGKNVDIKGSDVVVEVTDGTKPVPNSGPGTGIVAGDDVTAEDSNVDVIVTGKPGTGIKPGDDNKVEVKGDTVLDIETKPSDPNAKPGEDGEDPAPAIDGDLVIPKTDPAKPGSPKPNIIIKGTPKPLPDDKKILDEDGHERTDIKPNDKGEIIVENKYVTAELKVPGTEDEFGVVKVKGTIGQTITDVTGVTVTLTEGTTFAKGSDGKYMLKTGDRLTTNLSGVSAVVAGMNDAVLNLTLGGTPKKNCGTAITVTLPAGSIKDVKIAVKVTDDAAHWAVKLGDTIGREDPLGIAPNPAPGGYDPTKPVGPDNKKYDPNDPIIYIDENGEEKRADPNEDITDTAEGWEWYPEKPAPKPGDPGYEPGDETKYPDGYVADESDGKKYPRPAMILEDVDIKPASPNDPGVEVPDDVTIVVPPGSDNIIEGHPAIKVGPNPVDPTEKPEISITGPGNLILKGVPGPATSPAAPGYPAIEGPTTGDPAIQRKPIILVDPDIIVNGDDHPVEKKEKKDPDTNEPMYDKDGSPIYEIETPDDNNIVFGHVSATLNNVKKGGIPGTTNTAIADASAKVELENASLMPGKVTTRTVFDTNTAGVKAKVVGTAGGSTINVLLTGTPANKTNDKIMVFVPAEYVMEGASLTAASTERWNIVDSPAPNPGDGGNTPTPPSGSITVDDKDKNVDVKKEVKREDNKKIDIFTPDKEQLDEIIKDLPKGDEVMIEVKRDSDADEVIIKVNGETLDEMGKKGLDLKVLDAPISINIPTKKIDITPILEELGGDAKDVDVNIRIYAPTDEEKEAIRKAIETDGSKQTDEPISFEISVSKDGKTVPVDGFDGYVTVALQITEEQAKLITTAVTWQKDGSLLHIPTYVLKESGKYYARVNALVNCTTTLIFNKQNFVDTEGTWYDAVAAELASRKIMNGVGNGKFEGGLNITRAEFAVIVVRALGLPVNDTNIFSDVSGGDWYAGAAGAASKYGIVKGADGKFMPTNQITRQEAMAIIARAAKVAEYTGTTGSMSGYFDGSALADWAEEAAAMTVGSGLIKGSDGQLRPTDTITRGETAVLILRLLQKADLVDVRSVT